MVFLLEIVKYSFNHTKNQVKNLKPSYVLKALLGWGFSVGVYGGLRGCDTPVTYYTPSFGREQ